MGLKGANTVEPIRDPDQIREMKEHLLHKSYRDYFLFAFGINSGLRIGDILPLRVMDVASATHLRIKEQKTGKIRKVRMTVALQQEIAKYTKGLSCVGLFVSVTPGQQADQPGDGLEDHQ